MLTATKVEVRVSKTTTTNYARQYKLMIQEAVARRTYSDETENVRITAIDLVNDLFENNKLLKESTLYIRRNALIHALKNQQQTIETENALKLLYDPVYKSKIKNIGGVGKINSRKPGRMIPFDDYELIIKKLFHMGKWGQATQHFLAAGCASGARPIEWINAKWIDFDNNILRLRSAKIKINNAWDKIPGMLFTDLDIDDELNEAVDTQKLSEHEIEKIDFERKLSQATNLTIEEKNELRHRKFIEGIELFRDVKIENESKFNVVQHMNSIKYFFDNIDPLYDSESMPIELKRQYYETVYFDRCRNTMFRACKELFPATDPTQSPIIYSLVDARSTFASNRKAAFGIEAAARELGHTITTSRNHYAPMRDAWAKYRRNGQNAEVMQQSDMQAPTENKSATRMMPMSPAAKFEL